MSHFMTAIAMKQKGLKPAAKIVLYWLSDHHNSKTGLCCPSLKKLAEECEMSRSSVTRHLSDLEEIGLIRRVQRSRDNGSQTSTQYFLSLEMPVSDSDGACLKMTPPPVSNCDPHNLGNNNLGNNTPKPPEGADLFSQQDQDVPEADDGPDEIDQGFTEFWDDVWPRHSRKKGKYDCAKVYRAACEGKHKKADKIAPDVLNRAARAYIASLRGDLTYLKGTLPWLRQPGWEPFLDVAQKTEVIPFTDLTLSQQSALREGRVPPSMMENDKPNVTAAHWLKFFEGRKS